MIEYKPTAFVLGSLPRVDDIGLIQKAQLSWEGVANRFPKNVKILAAAANFCVLSAPKASEKYWQRAIKLDPLDEDLWRELAFLYSLNTQKVRSKSDRGNALKMFSAAKKAFELHKKKPKPSYLENYMEIETRKFAEVCLKFNMLEAASYFGNYLLDRQVKYKERASKFEVHTAHCILGQVALKRRRVALAEKHLLTMPKYGSADWRFDLVLANKMLEKGQREVVIQYLDGVKEEIEASAAKVKKTSRSMSDYLAINYQRKIDAAKGWIKALRAGKNPELSSHL
jgi:phage antirepressor YoqD-like protein